MMTDSEQRRLIVFFHPGHPNHVLMLRYIKPALAARGYCFEEISFRDPAALTLLGQLLVNRGPEIFCLYSMNFYIKELALRNTWIAKQHEFDKIDSGEIYLNELTGIPLVIHVYDHPIYLLKHESSAFNEAIVFVNGEDIIDFMEKHFQSRCRYVPIPSDVIIPALMPAIAAPDFEQFLGRHNAIWCPMNLSVQNLSVDGHWAQIKALPTTRRDRAIRHLDAALYDCLTPVHIVSERLAAAGDPEIEIADQLHVANFVKLWRRTTLVRKLIELPMLVSSDFVPADLNRKYPDKFIQTSMAQTLEYYSQFRFSLNSFPLHNEALHDRIINPFLANTVVISDRNALSSRLYEDGLDLVFLDYEMPSMAAKVQRYLDNPESAFQITANRYERWIAYELEVARGPGRSGLCDELIEAVKERWRERTVPHVQI